MKRVKLNLKHVVLIMTGVVFFSCSKGDTGDTGPIGLQGPQGEQGIQGPAGQDGEALGVPGPQGDQGPAGQNGTDGQDGADGENGNANVIVSDWIDTGFSVAPFNISSFEINVQNININGATLVYGKTASGGIFPFPYDTGVENYTYYLKPGTGSFPNVTPNKMGFLARSTNNSDRIFDEFAEVRYVNIPPQSSGKSSIDFMKMAYEEVMDHFGFDH